MAISVNENGTWQQLLKNKYFSNKMITQTKGKLGVSHFWSGLIKVKYEFLKCGKFIAKDESQTRFLKDTWVDDIPLCKQFPDLYNISNYQKNSYRIHPIRSGSS
jgi:hypothetical protein